MSNAPSLLPHNIKEWSHKPKEVQKVFWEKREKNSPGFSGVLFSVSVTDLLSGVIYAAKSQCGNSVSHKLQSTYKLVVSGSTNII